MLTRSSPSFSSEQFRRPRRPDSLVAGLSPDLLQRLTRARLEPGHAVAAGGFGERRSRSRGEGIEFEEHRPYQVGDDFRRVDPKAFARLGERFVRQYNMTQQLRVTLLVDASTSMNISDGGKFEFARNVAEGLAYVALAGSDSVQVGVLAGDSVSWLPAHSGLGRFDDVRAWIRQRVPHGGSDLRRLVDTVRPRLSSRGVSIVISDWWSETAHDAIDGLAAAEQVITAVQVLSRSEVEPEALPHGPLRLVDVESGEDVDIVIGPDQVAHYHRLLSEHTDQLRDRLHQRGGMLVRLTDDDTMEDVFLRSLPRRGVLR